LSYQFDISVIIVNYKVKEYIVNLLNSLEKAREDYSIEVFVVDNDSGDNSVEYLKERYPEVNYIQNTTNYGFGRANNQAIEKAEGRYTLLINPDTLVSEDTLEVLVNHMEKNPRCGAAGCKILNPDGSFAPESRRSVPTIRSAAFKVFGLTNLFPKSKYFGEYYLGWMDEDTPSKIPVLSGSFMFFRTKVLKELGGFDERFFMYGEDIDLCYRLNQTGYHIDYVPDTSIIHYKGESTKKDDTRYIKLFNKALYQFFDKHYTHRYSTLFRFLIYLAILLRGIGSFFVSRLNRSKYILLDVLFLNLTLIAAFVLRFSFTNELILRLESLNFLWVNALLSLLYIFFGMAFNLFKDYSHSISNSLKTIFFSYAGVVLITFFARSFAFSRLVLALGLVFGAVTFVLVRFIRINYNRQDFFRKGRIRSTRICVVGMNEKTKEFIAKVNSHPNWQYEIAGIIAEEEKLLSQPGVIGTLPQLKDLIRSYQIDQVFFMTGIVPYKEILTYITLLKNETVTFKMISESMDFILGKSNVEYFDSIPVVEVEIAYQKPTNLFLKRMLDLSVSVPAWAIFFLLTWPAQVFTKAERRRFKTGVNLYEPVYEHKLKNYTIIWWYILKGKWSLCGSPIGTSFTSNYNYKPGLTGPIQVNGDRIEGEEARLQFELHYLQNYSIWYDLDLIFKTVIKGLKPLDHVATNS